MNEKLESFSPGQVSTIDESVSIAEELVSNYYKMSGSQWLHLKYDIETLVNLCNREIVHGPFAQVVRYEGKRKGGSLSSSSYDLYKICLQDHTILSKLEQSPDLKLFPFSMYIVTHELIHIVRFCKFLQNFEASHQEKMAEERRVHENTYRVLNNVRVSGMEDVFNFYRQWIT